MLKNYQVLMIYSAYIHLADWTRRSSDREEKDIFCQTPDTSTPQPETDKQLAFFHFFHLTVVFNSCFLA